MAMIVKDQTGRFSDDFLVSEGVWHPSYHIYYRSKDECKFNKPAHHIAFESAAEAEHWLSHHTTATYNFHVYREVMQELTYAGLYKYARLEGDK